MFSLLLFFACGDEEKTDTAGAENSFVEEELKETTDNQDTKDGSE